MHLHAFLKLDAKIHKRDPSFADIDGYHPNITQPRSIKAVIQYVQKDGDFIASPGIKDLLDRKSYGSLIEESNSAEEFINNIKKYYPRDLVLGYDKIKAFTEYQYKDANPVFNSPFSHVDFLNVVPEMQEWVLQQLPLPVPNPMVIHNIC